ncbi:MAG TPA: hypothetical protein VID48_04240 [Solirubrobacteraceae bacterium]|jgi:hypothetical protein
MRVVNSLERLIDLLREQGGLMASLVSPLPEASEQQAAPAGPAQVAAAGPRTESQGEEYELLIEAIYEGYLLHYETARVTSVAEADLRLLAGDQLYALGLSRLVAMGDVRAVIELADVITLSALAQGAGERELAQAIWSAGAHAVGWGQSELYAQAKDLALAGAPQALAAMRTSTGS